MPPRAQQEADAAPPPSFFAFCVFLWRPLHCPAAQQKGRPAAAQVARKTSTYFFVWFLSATSGKPPTPTPPSLHTGRLLRASWGQNIRDAPHGSRELPASGGAGNDVVDVDVGSALHPAAVRAPSLVSSYVARYRHLTWHLGRHRASVHVCGGAGVPVAVAGPLALQRLLCCLLWLCLPCRACIAAGCFCVTAGRAQLPMRSHWWLRSGAGYV